MNFVSTYSLIKALGLKHCETHHSRRYKTVRNFRQKRKILIGFQFLQCSTQKETIPQRCLSVCHQTTFNGSENSFSQLSDFV